MFLFDKIDVSEEEIKTYSAALLKELLMDRTTRKNILWATDNYIEQGEAYAPDCEIRPELITGDHAMLIQPRVSKSDETQDSRTKDKAEVFTPSWVCNEQNSLVDEQWFGRKNVFNTITEKGWSVNEDKIEFPEGRQKAWGKYVDAKRLEVSCGEAPYLVSRYDTVTGQEIPLRQRVGLLDRKLRVVNENTETREDWLKWAIRAFQAVYGFEYQGDNLLLARENLLVTFIEYYSDRFQENAPKGLLLKIARIISWNLWQMDGLKFVVPNSCKPLITEDVSLFGTEIREEPCPGCASGNIHKHTGIYSRIYDWRDKSSLAFVTMMKGARS